MTGPDITLGIESSCDETAASVVLAGREILANVVHSQIPIHARYGGVVPELASRNHVLAIVPVVEEALRLAAVKLSDVDLFAVTCGPGLVGALMVGLEFAKMLAFSQNTPLVGVHHIEGHMLSPFVDPKCRDLEAPYIALVVSGGHSSLYHVSAIGRYERLGRTLDDAAGEAFDKVAKRLGASYPGGPFIEKTAMGGDPHRFPVPRPMLNKGNYNFSFSGLKTSVNHLVAQLEADPTEDWLCDLAASVQEAISEVLVKKTVRAARQTQTPRIVLAGGVACNTHLRAQLRAGAAKHEIQVFIPDRTLCTDNAAMIACAGALRIRHCAIPPPRGFTAHHLDAASNFPIPAPGTCPGFED